MMLRVLIFNVLYIASCLFALARGGAPERIGAAILIANFQLSHWVIEPLDSRYDGVEWPMVTVVFAAFLALYALSLFSSRYWPILMDAVQGCVALSHLTGLSADIIPWAYGNFVVVWAYILLGILACATWRHRKRLRRYGIDPAWRNQLSAAYRMGRPVDESGPAKKDDPGP